jgi:RND family efflux transporter MFP subunit
MPKPTSERLIPHLSLALILASCALPAVVSCKGEAGGKPAAGKGGKGGMKISKAAVVELTTAKLGRQLAIGEYQGEFVADRVAEVSADVAGPVTKINVRLGDVVKQDELLALIDPLPFRQAVREGNASSAQAKAQRAEARVLRADLERQLRQQRPLLERQLIAQSAIDALEASLATADQRIALADASQAAANARLASAQENLKRVELRSPIAGVVAARMVEPGRYLTPGTMLFRIVDPSSAVLRVMVPEQDSGLIKPGLATTIYHVSLKGGQCAGSILRIAPALDPASRSLPVELSLDPACADSPPRPGMFARATIALGDVPDAVLVPNQALVRGMDGEQFLWIAKDGKATRREVQLGLRGRETSQIVSGLAAGESIVLRGQDRVSEGGEVVEVAVKRDEVEGGAR